MACGDLLGAANHLVSEEARNMSRLGRFGHFVLPVALVTASLQIASAVETTKANPNASHWQNGEVRWQQKWVRFDQLPSDAARNLALYEKTRDTYPATLEGRLALADWCAKHRLADQE